MGFLSEDERSSLKLERMIFHVVGKTLDEPVILDEIDPLQEAEFFLERVKAAARGNLFRFREHSETERHLRSIRLDPTQFGKASAALARDFNDRHKSQMSNGALFLFDLSAQGDARFFAIVKYDHEEAVNYTLHSEGGRQQVVLRRFAESFVKKNEAMQKVALVRLGDTGGDIAVYDRSYRTNISEYFKGFLRAQRVHDETTNSAKLAEAFKRTFSEHRNILPPAVKAGGLDVMYDRLRAMNEFDPDKIDGPVTAVFGQVDENSPILRTLRRNLRSQGIADEAFQISADGIRKPKRRRIKTFEGVTIRYDVEGADSIKQNDLADGRTQIVITTQKIVESDVDDGARGD